MAGVREYTGTSGRLVRQTGNAYLHFLTAFLLKFDTTFKYSKGNTKDIDRLAKKGYNIE